MMKIDLLPTGAAAVCGGCAVAFGQPVLAFMATNVELACGVAAAAILAGAAWAGMPRRRRPDPLPDLGTFSPPLSCGDWLAANGVRSGEDPGVAATLIRAALERQLMASTLRETRVEVLFLSLLKTASQAGGSTILQELAEAAAEADPEAGMARLVERHGLRTDPLVIALRDRIAADHGTAATMILAALDQARRAGPCPSSAMTWLKRVDRGLWYAVSNLGRRAHLVEGIGAIAHYGVELSDGVRSPDPKVDAATRALVKHLFDLQPAADVPEPVRVERFDQPLVIDVPEPVRLPA
ncbi:secretion/conjugation apparatus DotM-related subunit [Methylobacterium radiotolerans]|uniref:secretion/conjugation apparatus DotM-related subunit n=1 Tax=Methylobacterium radiotolerans TaxID=31998 RepID=UPI0038CF7B83